MKFIIILGICLSLCSCTNEYREFRTTQTKVQETTSVQSLNDAGFSQSGVSISEVDLIVGPSSQILKNILSMTRSSTKTLRVNLYLLSHQEIITALIQAQKRGVDVRVILEKTVYQFAKINKESFEKLQK